MRLGGVIVDRLSAPIKQPPWAVQPVQSAAPSALDILGYLFLGLAWLQKGPPSVVSDAKILSLHFRVF